MSRPTRVLWLTKGLGQGGVEQLLVSLARAHDRARVQPSAAYVVPWKDALVGDLRAAGVDVTCLGTRRGGLDPTWVARLDQLIRKGDFDVVHSHSPLLAGPARLLVRRRGRRPRLVTTEHNAWRTFAPPTRLLNALTAPLDDARVAVSDEARRSIWWPRTRARAETVVHGVDLGAITRQAPARTAVRAELGVGGDEVLVLTVANLRAQKAYPVLLDAARRAIERCPQVRFVAVGQGPLEADVRARLSAFDLGERFRLLGARRDVHRLLAGADVFVLASVYEGYPVALMEALAAGLPVVATAVGGVTDAVTDGVEGRLVAPNRPDLLAAGLVELITDPARRAAMAASAAERARAFDIQNTARRLEALYDGVVSRHR